MSTITVVRYTTTPETAGDNAALIRDVFAELADQHADGIRYASLLLDDGVSFVHVAAVTGEHNPLTTSRAFRAFQAGLADRCVQGPRPSAATPIGSHRLNLW